MITYKNACFIVWLLLFGFYALIRELIGDDFPLMGDIGALFLFALFIWDFAFNYKRFRMSINYLDGYDNDHLLEYASYGTCGIGRTVENVYVRAKGDDLTWRELDYALTHEHGFTKDEYKEFKKTYTTCGELCELMSRNKWSDSASNNSYMVQNAKYKKKKYISLFLIILAFASCAIVVNKTNETKHSTPTFNSTYYGY